MPERRGRGRPKKVGKWKYFIKTGAVWGNLGTSSVAWNRPTIVKDTDTEAKRAAQAFFEKFQAPKHAASCTQRERDALAELIMELDNLHEAQAPWEPDSFEAGALWFEWSFLWGDQGKFSAVVEITRAKAEDTIKTGGLL